MKTLKAFVIAIVAIIGSVTAVVAMLIIVGLWFLVREPFLKSSRSSQC